MNPYKSEMESIFHNKEHGRTVSVLIADITDPVKGVLEEVDETGCRVRNNVDRSAQRADLVFIAYDDIRGIKHSRHYKT